MGKVFAWNISLITAALLVSTDSLSIWFFVRVIESLWPFHLMATGLRNHAGWFLEEKGGASGRKLMSNSSAAATGKAHRWLGNEGVYSYVYCTHCLTVFRSTAWGPSRWVYTWCNIEWAVFEPGSSGSSERAWIKSCSPKQGAQNSVIF